MLITETLRYELTKLVHYIRKIMKQLNKNELYFDIGLDEILYEIGEE